MYADYMLREEPLTMWSASQASHAASASMSYPETEQCGPAAQPLHFPAPRVHRVTCMSVTAVDHLKGRVQRVSNVLVRASSDRAYLIRRKISASAYGTVRICIVLKRRHHLDEQPAPQAHNMHHEDASSLGSDVSDPTAEWISTDERVVLKASCWNRMRSGGRQSSEDPLKEAAALLHVGNYHQNILGCIEILQDEDFLYTIMPYCPGGDLHSRVMGTTGNNASPQRKRFSKSSRHHNHRRTAEDQARKWFRQLLGALFHLQKKGICHGDVSLENLLLDKNNNVVLADFGLALRVPYLDASNFGGVADVSEGNCRRLISNSNKVLSGGNRTYLAPELVENQEEFDGFSIDLWSASVVLFVLLVGMAPFEKAHLSDYRYREISQGKLRQLLLAMDIKLSDDACDLLQKLLWHDPCHRLTLREVFLHPWVLGNETPPPPPDEERDELTPRRAFSAKAYSSYSSLSAYTSSGKCASY